MRYLSIWPIIAACSLGMGSPSPAGPVAQTWRFDVPRQRAAGGIAAFSRQATTVQLLVAQDALRGRRTNRLSGSYPVEEGLTMLLRGSGLRWLRTGPTTYSLVAFNRDPRR